MKKKTSFKIIFTVIMTIALIAISGNVLAATEECTILQKPNEEYIVYLNSSIDKEFEFAYTNKELENDDELDYIKNAKDSTNGNLVAYVDSNLYEKYFKDAENTYLWAKAGDEYLAKGIKIDLSNAITEDMVTMVKETTTRISVNTENKDVVSTEVDGVKYTTTTGKIEITDNQELSYYYVMIDTKKSEDYAKLMSLAETINKMDSENTVTKLNNSKEFYDLYSKLLASVKETDWIKVQDMKISQPEEAQIGDKYVVLIRQGDDVNARYDAQFMTCYRDDAEEYVKDKQVVKTTSKLPITYDSIALFVVLGVAVALFIVVLVVRNKSKKENK